MEGSEGGPDIITIEQLLREEDKGTGKNTEGSPCAIGRFINDQGTHTRDAIEAAIINGYAIAGLARVLNRLGKGGTHRDSLRKHCHWVKGIDENDQCDCRKLGTKEELRRRESEDHQPGVRWSGAQD